MSLLDDSIKTYIKGEEKRIQSIFDYNALIFQEMTEKTNESFDENLILETNFLKHIYSNNNFNYSQKKSTIKTSMNMLFCIKNYMIKL